MLATVIKLKPPNSAEEIPPFISESHILVVGRREEFLTLGVGEVKPLPGRIEQLSGHLFIIDRLGSFEGGDPPRG